MKYHPVIEMLGVHRFKSAELSDAFLKEIRLFSKKNDFESGPYLEDDAKKSSRPHSSEEVAGTSKTNAIA
jgi:hypothetical protein